MSELLAACPCGKTPTDVYVYDANQGGKWANVVPNCCGEWMIEFRTNYKALDSDECKRLAVEAWNSAPRAANELSSPAAKQSEWSANFQRRKIVIDETMIKRLLVQVGTPDATVTEKWMEFAKAIFIAGMHEEREACAKLCESIDPVCYDTAGYLDCAAQIRARSNA